MKNGLGNRLRAFASAAAVAAALGRPVMVVWVRDLHCNCSFRNLFKLPLRYAVLEEELPLANLTADRFQVNTHTHERPFVSPVRSFLMQYNGKYTHASLPGVQLHAAGGGGGQRRAGGDQP